MTVSSKARIGVDIGGTFTDVALEVGDQRFTAKTLTTSRAPEEGVLSALHSVTTEASVEPGAVSVIIHGTTLATNALIERKGAKTALLTTEGFRDVVEIRHENRFEQYDVNIDLPEPLVPRRRRLPIRERVDARGEILIELDESSVSSAIEKLAVEKVEAVAVGFLHSFTNPDHERRVGEAVARALPDVAVTLSSDVSPEMREYERFSTACANAYLQPLISRYLANLERELDRVGRVQLPVGEFTSADQSTITELFEAAYRRLYSRSIPGVEIEILTWVLALSAPPEGELARPLPTKADNPKPRGRRSVFDPNTGEFVQLAIFWRPDLKPGVELKGPAVIAEDETSTIISALFEARIDRFGYIELTRRENLKS